MIPLTNKVVIKFTQIHEAGIFKFGKSKRTGEKSMATHHGDTPCNRAGSAGCAGCAGGLEQRVQCQPPSFLGTMDGSSLGKQS